MTCLEAYSEKMKARLVKLLDEDIPACQGDPKCVADKIAAAEADFAQYKQEFLDCLNSPPNP